MKIENPELINALVDSLPVNFLSHLHQSIPGVYSEAYAMAFDAPTLQKPEAEYLMPHNRRALFETSFRQAAIDSGLKASAKPNRRATASYSLIEAGPFLITASYVCEPRKFVRSALFRNSHAELNKYLAQGQLFGEEKKEEEDSTAKANKIYCILLHGADAENSKKLGFMQFAFPDMENKKWVDDFDFMDVMNTSLNRKATASHQEQDNAYPSVKRKTQRGSE